MNVVLSIGLLLLTSISVADNRIPLTTNAESIETSASGNLVVAKNPTALDASGNYGHITTKDKADSITWDATGNNPANRSLSGDPILCSCDGTFSVGDTVVCLVDAPWDNTSLTIGDTGTVICGGNFAYSSVLVQWDNFDDGHANNNCECNPADPSDADNRWWVTCEMVAFVNGPSCAPDLNSDGTVNVSDLLELIAAWGACP